MKLTNAEKYSIIFIKELHSKPTTVQTISMRHSIPYDFLQQLSLKLRRAGLVKAARGVGGGMMREDRKVTLLDVVRAVTYKTNKEHVNCPLQQVVDSAMESIVIQ